jgi:hypothetical protein
LHLHDAEHADALECAGAVNAALVAQAGAGCNLATVVPDGALFPVLQDGEPDPASVAATIERLLHDDAMRDRADDLAAEMRSGCAENEAADLIEQVVASGAPVLRL